MQNYIALATYFFSQNCIIKIKTMYLALIDWNLNY